MSSIYLYAELLLNIGQVTVFIILPSNSHQSTQIDLLPDRRTLRVRHDAEQAVIQLPCDVLSNPSLTFQNAATRELSFRLQISDAAKSASQAKSAIDNDCPWPASNFTAKTQIGCQSCSSPLVGSVTIWKDLPSGGWADMMDFWHCHKPTVENGNDSSVGATKGYAASNALEPGAGVGLVDISHLIFLDANCTGVQVCKTCPPVNCQSNEHIYFIHSELLSMRFGWANKKEACLRSLNRSSGKAADTIVLEEYHWHIR